MLEPVERAATTNAMRNFFAVRCTAKSSGAGRKARNELSETVFSPSC